MIYDIISDICGLVGVAVFVYKLVRIIRSRDVSEDWLNGICLCGLVGFLAGLIGQLLYIRNVFEAVADSKEPDLNAIAGGLSESTFYSLNGLIVLTILLISWGFLKGLITYRKSREIQVHKR